MLRSHVFQLLICLMVSGMANAATPKSYGYLNDSLPESWNYVSEFSPTLPTDDNWWNNFEDPLLDSLINAGVSNNYNLAMATHRIEIARRTMQQVQSQYMPTVGFDGSWNKSRNSGFASSQEVPAGQSSYFSLGVDMSWQIDLFGKIASQSRQKKAAWHGSQAEYAGTMISVCGEIASVYAQLRMYQAEMMVATEHIASQEKVVKIAEARHEAGLASMLDVAQAKTIFYSTQASIPGLQNSINASINSLAVLLGVYPEEIEATLQPTGKLPEFRQLIGIGMPAQLLRRRPDIVAAEYSLAEAAAGIGIAKKDFLPTVTLEGSVGTMAHSAKDLFKHNSITYSIGPRLSWTLFSGMSRKYALASAKEAMEIQIENYNLTVLTAYEEVSNSISSYISVIKQLDVLDKVVEQSQKSFELSIDLYKRGLSSFTNVADAQMSYLTYANQIVVARGQAVIALVNLYKALGGGWTADDLIR